MPSVAPVPLTPSSIDIRLFLTDELAHEPGQCLRCEVENRHGAAIPDLCVYFSRPGGADSPFIRLTPAATGLFGTNDLTAGATAVFVATPAALGRLREQLAELPAEQCGLVMFSDREAFAHLGGADLRRALGVTA